MAVTGRISLAAQPWLADHVVHGTVILPGAAFAELAWHAGMLAGCPVIEDLTLLVPLVLPASGGVQVQVLVGAADKAGRRSLTVSARAAGTGGEWVRHVAGTAGPGGPSRELRRPGNGRRPARCPCRWPRGMSGWLELGSGHGRRSAGGRRRWAGVRCRALSVWRRRGAARGLAILSGAARRGVAEHRAGRTGGGLGAGEGELLVPFAWAGLVLAPGAAGVLRVVVAPAGADAVSVTVADAAGVVAARAEQVRFRPVTRGQVAGAGAEATGGCWRWSGSLSRCRPVRAGLRVAWRWPRSRWRTGRCRLWCVRCAGGCSGAVQGCLGQGRGDAAGGGDPRGSRGGAGGGGRGWRAAGLAGAAAWGLVRSAQAEEPAGWCSSTPTGRRSRRLRCRERSRPGSCRWRCVRGRCWSPAVPCRGGGMPPRPVGPSIPWSGPVLVTGGTGTLGGVVARHLAAKHGAGELVLASRRGPGAPGAGVLAADLAGRGATVRIAACDTADKEALAGLTPAAAPLAGVVHCAGVLDDGAVGIADRAAAGAGAGAEGGRGLASARADCRDGPGDVRAVLVRGGDFG